MSKLLFVLKWAAAGALLCGLIGALWAGVPAVGMSVALRSGLVVAGWLALGIIGGSKGAVVGFVVGAFVGAVLVFVRR